MTTTTTRSSATAAPETGACTAGNILKAVAESTAGKYCRQLDPLIEFAKRHPSGSGTILEMHLDKAIHCFDYGIRFNTAFDGKVLQKPCMDTSMPLIIQEGYAALLTGSKNNFQHGIQNFWFEYDAPFYKAASVFFDVGRDKHHGLRETLYSLEAISDNFQLSLPGGLQNFLNSIRALNLYVMYYGFMLSRNSESVRLTLNGIQPGNLLQVLDRLQWKGNKAQVQRLTALYLDDATRLVLAVDFGENMEARIGIEVFYEQPLQMIDALQPDKIIDQEQHLFFNRWPGRILLSPAISGPLYRLYDRSCEWLYKRINHIKFVLDGEQIATKVYLYYCF